MTFGIQPIHILVIILVAFLIFGPERLPEMGRNIGKAINELRKGTREMTDILRGEINNPSDTGKINNATMAKTPFPNPAASVQAPHPSIAPAGVGNFCIQCGAPNTPNALFCNQCGTKLPEKVIKPPDLSVPSNNING
jgi:TatA/E family protein of Tat protein translocase